MLYVLVLRNPGNRSRTHWKEYALFLREGPALLPALPFFRHCRFFLPGSRGDCSEPNAERPAGKESANFCDWFSLDQKYRTETAGQKKESDRADAAKKSFDNLFN